MSVAGNSGSCAIEKNTFPSRHKSACSIFHRKKEVIRGLLHKKEQLGRSAKKKKGGFSEIPEQAHTSRITKEASLTSQEKKERSQKEIFYSGRLEKKNDIHNRIFYHRRGGVHLKIAFLEGNITEKKTMM